MEAVTNYLYVFAPLLGALLIAIGFAVVTINAAKMRHARAWFLCSAAPFFLVPVVFGITAPNAVIGVTGASIGAFLLGVIYYVADRFILDHIRHDAQGT